MVNGSAHYSRSRSLRIASHLGSVNAAAQIRPPILTLPMPANLPPAGSERQPLAVFFIRWSRKPKLGSCRKSAIETSG